MSATATDFKCKQMQLVVNFNEEGTPFSVQLNGQCTAVAFPAMQLGANVEIQGDTLPFTEKMVKLMQDTLCAEVAAKNNPAKTVAAGGLKLV